MKKLVFICLALSSFALTSANVISGEFIPDVTDTHDRKRPTPLSLSSETSSSEIDEQSSLDSLEFEVRRIAIIGGGGAGSVTAILLSNLSKQARRYGLRFEITIFERNPEIITGSAFEIAAVLHAGGCEYPEDIDTIVDCKAFGALFEQMFSDTYDDNSLPIMYFTRTGSNLTPEMQQEAFIQARQAMKNAGSPTTPTGQSSQRKLPVEIIQDVFGPSISGGVRSTKDKSMKIFERNTKIRNCIDRDLDITVKTNACVSGIVKNEDGTFCIMVDDKLVGQVDHAIITTWSNNQNILDASKSFYDLGFVAEDRVIALCDISDVPYLQNIPFFILEGGLMFMPVSSELGLVYRCIEGGSYPESGKTEIDPKEVNIITHGEKILEELKEAFSSQDREGSPFEKVKLLGAKLLSAVKESGRPSNQRPHVPPVVTKEGYIVGTPTKATYIPWLALQMVEKFLGQLSDSSGFSNLQEFKENWLKKIQNLFSPTGEFCTGGKLPEPLIIRGVTEKKDIEDEKLKLFENFKLTDEGRLCQSKLHDASPLRRRALTDPWVSVVASGCSDNNSTSPVSVLELPQPVNKARSDSFIDRELSSPLNLCFDFMVNSDSPKIKLENPIRRSGVSLYKDSEACFISFINGIARDPMLG
jgi:hypothetical protein